MQSAYGDDFASWDGTSFSTALVAAGAALILEKYPGLRPDQVEQLLQQSAQPDNCCGDMQGNLGAGVLDLMQLGRQLAVVVAAIQTLGVGGTTKVFLQHNTMTIDTNIIIIMTILTLLTQFLSVSGILPTMALLTSLAAISLNSMAAASL